MPSLLDQVCAGLDIKAEDAPRAEVEALDEHYMRPRYPDSRPEVGTDYGLEIATEALNHARVVLEFVREKLQDAGANHNN